MRDRVLDQNFAKVLVGMSCGVKFNLTQLTEHSCVVRLNVNRTWFDTTVYDVAVVENAETFGNVAQVLKAEAAVRSYRIQNHTFEHITAESFFKKSN